MAFSDVHVYPVTFTLRYSGVFLCPRPSVLDNFALLSGQLNTINKLLRNEKTPSLRNQVIIPLLLSPDRDEDLAVSIFPLDDSDPSALR